MKRLLLVLFTLFCWSGLFGQASDELPTELKEKLIVATKEAPPFSFKNENDEWVGITIELWEAVAGNLGLRYEYVEYDLADALDAVSKGKADVGAAAISVTADRAKQMDFTHTYYGSALAIATNYQKNDLWTVISQRVFTWTFFRAIFILMLVLLIAGALVWLFERKHNPDHFGGRPLHGLGAAFWWSAVTMTTVGYGDKAPTTAGGRFIGLVWMFTSIIIISGLTGAIATALTVGSLTPRVKGPRDLRNVRVGAIQESVADDYLQSIGVTPQYFNSVREGLQAVSDDSIGAFVHDNAILGYWAGKDFSGSVDVLQNTFEPSYLALAMPIGHHELRPIDIALLEYVQTPAWDALLEKYRAAQ
ncbi:transporter substrate-binding domain-containing protein [Cerasicoccus arenae]|uniref:Amino acid ABC transporter substrate-binding protein n=1 Tax=Cerasicoccus arenae TaxID=424488 RepID=A0A8J3GDD9_9BACT|nr:transporter substrate-binding domain-containing protein [Cerasicoccus arenae]MBK1858853.1 transporter substrate-binding domain-containing protein [Cerasicoccus arenae]GHB96057.1 amino acid ABC transporter substrate-binding protein [Cerasicoccus arenae]